MATLTLNCPTADGMPHLLRGDAEPLRDLVDGEPFSRRWRVGRTKSDFPQLRGYISQAHVQLPSYLLAIPPLNVVAIAEVRIQRGKAHANRPGCHDLAGSGTGALGDDVVVGHGARLPGNWAPWASPRGDYHSTAIPEQPIPRPTRGTGQSVLHS